MAVLKNNEYKTATWSSKNKFITGLDPLGLQNTSEATYTLLMPGITNLTNRIRYYGLYCWLFEHYARHIRNTDPNEQNRYIRRAELMLALLMKTKDPDFTQVTGSLFAGTMIQAQPERFYDLKAGADLEPQKDTYWLFSAGAFGQYYAGAMSEIGLILRNDDGNFICSNETHHDKISGVMLAKAFEENTPEEARRIFLQNIQTGKLPIDQIDLLYEAFALNHIPLHSGEWELYLDLILEEDSPRLLLAEEQVPSFHRKETLHYFLRWLDETESVNNPNDFPGEIYQHKGQFRNDTSETLQLWYFYHLNELWHFGAGAAFWGLLHMLDTRYHQIHLPLFVKTFAEDIQGYFSETHDILPQTPIDEVLPLFHPDEPALIQEIIQAIRDGDIQRAAGSGLALLFTLFQHNWENQETLQSLAFSKGIIRDGNVLDFFGQIIKNLNTPMEDFLQDFTLRNLVYRHQYVALRKTGNGSQSTLKFLLEEHYIRHIQTFGPRFTSPRLSALHHMLQDLQLVNTQNELTPVGKAFLQTRF